MNSQNIIGFIAGSVIFGAAGLVISSHAIASSKINVSNNAASGVLNESAQELNIIAQNAPPPQGNPDQPPHHPPDLAVAAKKLGVSKEKLMQALGVTDQPPPQPNASNGSPNGRPPTPPNIEFAAAAKKLGVSEEKLKQALGVPNHQPHQRPNQRPRMDFTAAAKKLGISQQKLMQALGVPEKQPTSSNGHPSAPPRIDFAAAAKKLGISEQKLTQALGIPPHPAVNRP